MNICVLKKSIWAFIDPKTCRISNMKHSIEASKSDLDKIPAMWTTYLQLELPW